MRFNRIFYFLQTKSCTYRDLSRFTSKFSKGWCASEETVTEICIFDGVDLKSLSTRIFGEHWLGWKMGSVLSEGRRNRKQKVGNVTPVVVFYRGFQRHIYHHFFKYIVIAGDISRSRLMCITIQSRLYRDRKTRFTTLTVTAVCSY